MARLRDRYAPARISPPSITLGDRYARKQRFVISRGLEPELVSAWHDWAKDKTVLVAKLGPDSSHKKRGSWNIDTRKAMLKGQGGRCDSPWCRSVLTAERCEVDHKIPVNRGGSNQRDNLHVLCSVCNERKHTMTWEEWLDAHSH